MTVGPLVSGRLSMFEPRFIGEGLRSLGCHLSCIVQCLCRGREFCDTFMAKSVKLDERRSLSEGDES